MIHLQIVQSKTLNSCWMEQAAFQVFVVQCSRFVFFPCVLDNLRKVPTFLRGSFFQIHAVVLDLSWNLLSTATFMYSSSSLFMVWGDHPPLHYLTSKMSFIKQATEYVHGMTLHDDKTWDIVVMWMHIAELLSAKNRQRSVHFKSIYHHFFNFVNI